MAKRQHTRTVPIAQQPPVEAMSGELTVESTPGGGTTFVFGLRTWSGDSALG